MAGRRNPQLYTPDVLNPLDSEIEDLREQLVAHYQAMPSFTGNPLDKANDVLEACRVGWRNCPKTFAERVRVKSKMRHPGGSNLRTWGEARAQEASREAAIKRDLDAASPVATPAIDEVVDQLGREKILKTLKAPDKRFWNQREKYYRNEFDFNSSSDFSLLIEVISNELKIHKIHEMEFAELEKVPDADGENGPDPQRLLALSKMTAEAHKQLQDSLKALGVTRDQRRDEMDSDEGDIASLSIALDRKLKAQAAIDKAHQEEEESGLRRKYLRGDVYDAGLPRAIHNRIPDVDEVNEIIKEAGIHEDQENPRDVEGDHGG